MCSATGAARAMLRKGIFIAHVAAVIFWAHPSEAQERTARVKKVDVEWFRVGCPTEELMGRLGDIMGHIATGDPEARVKASRFVEQNCQLLNAGEVVIVLEQPPGSVLTKIKRRRSPQPLLFMTNFLE